MTRKDYEVIARVFAEQFIAVGDEDTLTNFAQRDTITALAERMSRELLSASKFDVNGNKSFKPEVFLKACGL